MARAKAARLRPQEHLPALRAIRAAGAHDWAGAQGLSRPGRWSRRRTWNAGGCISRRCSGWRRAAGRDGGCPTHARLRRAREGGGGWPCMPGSCVAPWLAQHLWTRQGPNPADPEPTPRPRTPQRHSATLMTGGSFAYWQARVGCPARGHDAAVPSPFAFATQACSMAHRGGRRCCRQDSLWRISGRAHRTHRGAAGGLGRPCTGALDQLPRAGRGLARLTGRLPWLMLCRGPAACALLRQFRADVHSVSSQPQLLGGGPIVVGEALSLVVIDRLPFRSPRRSLVGGAL